MTLTFITLAATILILSLATCTYFALTTFTTNQVNQFIRSYESIQTTLQGEIKYYSIELKKGMTL